MQHRTLARRAGGMLAAAGTTIPVYLLAIRPWHLRWGATDADVHRRLPGDELVPTSKLVATRAITIQAPAGAIWPWLLQLGADRGGLYSYDWLENLVGLKIHSADRIVPGLQNLHMGDVVSLVPNHALPLKVVALEPERVLVLAAGTDEAAPPATWVWSFILDPLDDQTTRLIVRSRLSYPPGVANVLTWRVFVEPAHFIMEQKMLRGIKQRAQRTAHAAVLRPPDDHSTARRPVQA